MTERTLVVAAARTPIGRYRGALASRTAPQLASQAIRAALRRAAIEPEAVQRVVLGQALQAGVGQNPARQAAVEAGIPMTVPALTVNAVCLSGTAAIAHADLLIRAGLAEAVVVGGMESMSNAPHLLRGSRGGLGFGSQPLLDAAQLDGLTDAFTGLGMGEATDADTIRAGWDREILDTFSASSHQRAAAAQASGILAAEIVPVTRVDGKGHVTTVSDDEGIRPDSTPEALAHLRPAFRPDGVLTAGSSSPISDGASALVLTSERFAERHGLHPLAAVAACASVAGPDTSLLEQPAAAIESALTAAHLTLDQVKRYEINEAFASVVLASSRRLGIDLERVNIDGGAIALGHPLGMSGARLVGSLALAIAAGRATTGVAGLCGGGGQGDAVTLRVA